MIISEHKGRRGRRVPFLPEGEGCRCGAAGAELVFCFRFWKSGDKDVNCYIASGMAACMDGIYTN